MGSVGAAVWGGPEADGGVARRRTEGILAGVGGIDAWAARAGVVAGSAGAAGGQGAGGQGAGGHGLGGRGADGRGDAPGRVHLAAGAGTPGTGYRRGLDGARPGPA